MILKGQTAISTPFDPSGTSLVSTDTESAIKEVLNASFDSSKALFDLCTPLFDHNESCNVELLIECGSD